MFCDRRKKVLIALGEPFNLVVGISSPNNFEFIATLAAMIMIGVENINSAGTDIVEKSNV